MEGRTLLPPPLARRPAVNAETVFILALALLVCGANFLVYAGWVRALSQGRRRHPWLGAVGVSWIILAVGIAFWWLLT